MQDQKHVIKKQVLEIHVSKHNNIHAIQNDMSRLYREKLVAIIDEVCNQFSPPGTIHRIDKLTIDLGEVNFNEIEDRFSQKFIEAIGQPNAITTISIPEEEVPGPNSRSSTTALFAYYLRTGTLPWWAKENSKAYILQVLNDLNQQPNALYKQILHQMCRDKFYMKRFIFTFSDKQIQQTLQSITSIPLNNIVNVKSELTYFINQKAHLIPKKPTTSEIRYEWWMAIAKTIPQSLQSAELVQKSIQQALKCIGLDTKAISFKSSSENSLKTSSDASHDASLDAALNNSSDSSFDTSLDTSYDTSKDSRLVKFSELLNPLEQTPQLREKGEIESLLSTMQLKYKNNSTLQQFIQEIQRLLIHPSLPKIELRLIKAIKKGLGDLNIPDTKSFINHLPTKHFEEEAVLLVQIEVIIKDIGKIIPKLPMASKKTLRKAVKNIEQFVANPVQSSRALNELIISLNPVDSEIRSILASQPDLEVFQKIKLLASSLKDAVGPSLAEAHQKLKDRDALIRDLISIIGAIPDKKTHKIIQNLKSVTALTLQPISTESSKKLNKVLAKVIVQIEQLYTEPLTLSKLDVQFLKALQQKNQKLLKISSVAELKSRNAENHLLTLVTKEKLQAISKKTHHLQKQLKQVTTSNNDKVIEKFHSSFDDTDPIPVSNAGIVIFWPFLTRLFENLELIQEKSFVNVESQAKAVAILQFLAFEEEDMFEPLLTLNKVICGVDLIEPLEIFDLNAEEKEIAEGLLNSVVSRGPLWKNLTLGGLRKSYLQREGLLRTRDGHWLLQVKKETYDVTLERLPWSFSTIKLPWMDELLMVDWL